jgi:hypothetical protein
MVVTATFVWAGEVPPAASPSKVSAVKGEVLEVKAVANFTYLRLKTDSGEVWAAVINTPVMQGTTVTIENAIVMKNFESKTLKKTFPIILFGSLAGAPGNAPGSSMEGVTGNPMGGMTGSSTGAPMTEKPASTLPKSMKTVDIHVPKAKGANARTVAEIVTKGTELKDKTVVVRGKVVKYNAGIMGKNWIHLRDGSGSISDNTNDILVTTANQTKLGDVVTARGVVHTDKDFGAGYAYKVLIEDATLQ